jgi:RNA polymerase sigma-70 factor (ECF subfamily)
LLGAEGLEYVLGEAPKVLATDSKSAEQSFEQIFLAHYSRVAGVLLRLVGDPSRAEDLAHAVFWKAYRQRAGSAKNDNVSAWLYRAATNLGIQELRAVARRQRYEHAAADVIHAGDEARTPLDAIIQRETRSQVRAILASLKRWQAQILVLRQSGLSYAELADALRLRKSSIGTMLTRAEAAFHKKYLQLHGSED